MPSISSSVSFFVRTFQSRFAELVESGAKPHTIRKTPVRMPKPGDRISLRTWTGKPYRSKQRILRESIIESVSAIRIYESSFCIGNETWNFNSPEADRLAVADGFEDFRDLQRWFRATHGLPFEGVLICWKIDQTQPSHE